MANRGKFIVFEGGEGSGKSTQIERLKSFLPKQYPDHQFVFTQEPGGSALANDIRSLIISDKAKAASGRTMLGLLMASRSDHVEQCILPSLTEGKIVTCDRYLASSYAYQIVGQKCPELADIFWAYSKTLPHPDRYLLFETHPEIARGRVGGRSEGSHFHDRALDFHERVREGYRTYFTESKLPHTVINGDQDIDGVWKEVQQAIESIL